MLTSPTRVRPVVALFVISDSRSFDTTSDRAGRVFRASRITRFPWADQSFLISSFVLRMSLFSTVVSPELLVKCVHRSITTSGAPLIVRSLYNKMSNRKPRTGKIHSQILRAVVASFTKRKCILQALRISQ